MANRSDLKWLDINDFTPGIHQIYSPQMPPGAARDTTEGCIATMRSGLTGMPSEDFGKRVTSISASDEWQVTGILAVPARFSTHPGDYVYGMGFRSNQTPLTDDSVTPHHSVMIYVAFEKVVSSARDVAIVLLGLASTPTITETIIHSVSSVGTVPTSDVAHTYLAWTRSIGDKDGAFARPITDVGTPVMVASLQALYDFAMLGDGSFSIMSPDPTDLPNALSPTVLDFGPLGTVTGNLIGTGRVLIHQNRILIAQGTYYGSYGLDPGVGTVISPYVITNDEIAWSQVNCVNLDYQQAFGDRPYSFGCWGSLTASDLLMITHGDGAILVQGDLNAPTVRRLPGVVGTAGLECDGAHTPIGFVYGVGGGGVYAWAGGDGSVHLSPQMADQFWVSQTAVKHRNHKGAFARWGNWILAPNGYLLDLDNPAKSWWRIDGSALPVINWAVSPNGAHAYGSPATFHVNPSGQVAVKGFNRFVRRESWSWVSHPFVVTAHRRVNVREVVLIAKATTTSSVTVTLTDDTGATSSKTFTVPVSSNSKALRADFAFNAYNLSATITSVSGQCEIYGLRIGYDEAENQPMET